MTDPKIVAELRRIADEHEGELRPTDVVKEAESPESPLHEHFEWDDSLAAQNHRLEQARKLIRVVVEVIGPARTMRTRVFVSLTPDRQKEDGGYRLVHAVLQNPTYRAQLLADALQEMQRFEKKYQDLTELAEVFIAMRRVSSNPGEDAA